MDGRLPQARSERDAAYRALHPQPTYSQFKRLERVLERVYEDARGRHYIVCNGVNASDDALFKQRAPDLQARGQHLVYYRVAKWGDAHVESSHRFDLPLQLTSVDGDDDRLTITRISEHGGVFSDARTTCAATGYLVAAIVATARR